MPHAGTDLRALSLIELVEGYIGLAVDLHHTPPNRPAERDRLAGDADRLRTELTARLFRLDSISRDARTYVHDTANSSFAVWKARAHLERIATIADALTMTFPVRTGATPAGQGAHRSAI